MPGRVKPNQLCRIINPYNEDIIEEHVGKVILTLDTMPGEKCDHGDPIWYYAPPLLEAIIYTPTFFGYIAEQGTLKALPECVLEPIEDGDPNEADMELLKIDAPVTAPKETA